MRRQKTAVVTVGLAVLTAGLLAQGQNAPPAPAARPARPASQTFQRKTEVGVRLDAADQKYAAIAAPALMRDVNELTAMARKYRDNGHPQFWGRIIGSEADAENAAWMMAKFRQWGLTDVRMQTIDLAPQWFARSWSVIASAKGKSVNVATAQPTYGGVAAPGGLDLELVWVGMGSDAEIAMSKDVRGKAAVFYSTDTGSRHIGIADNAIRRLGEKGAAAILIVQGIPGNLRTQFYPVGSQVPTFTVGQQDGYALRDLIASAGSDAPRLTLQLTVDTVPNLKSGTVWATLPGMTDETVVVVAHRDGWFEGANDNAAGVATMMAIAEYFSKVPKAERRRTMQFLGTTGHHNSGVNSGAWFSEHPEVFAKSALLVNCEHTGALQTGQNSTRTGNTMAIASWFAGSPKLSDVVLNALDAFEIPTYPQSGASPAGEIGRYHQFAPALQIMTGGYTWHSDQETDAAISPAGLTAVTRAYAKVIAETNGLDLRDLRTPNMSR